MNKSALGVDWGAAQRYGIGGAFAGLTAAAAIKLIHEIQADRERRKMLATPTDTEENTIVLRIPQKVAEIVGIPKLPAKTGPVSSNKKQTRKSVVMGGHYAGATGMKVGVEITKSANAATWAAKILAATGGAAAGYMLVDKLYRLYASKQLKGEEAAARQEMMQAMMPKTGVFGRSDAHWAKQTPETSQAVLDPVFGLILLGALGVGGGAAYLTKRILDAKTKENQTAGLDIPKVRRIVFQSVPVKSPQAVPVAEKIASDEDYEFVKVSIGCYKDLLSGESRLLQDVKLRQMLKDAGCDLDGMTKEAGHYAFLDKVAHPIVRRIQEAMEKDPALIRKLAAAGLKVPDTSPNGPVPTSLPAPAMPSDPVPTGAPATKVEATPEGQAQLAKTQPAPQMPPPMSSGLPASFEGPINEIINNPANRTQMIELARRQAENQYGVFGWVGSGLRSDDWLSSKAREGIKARLGVGGGAASSGKAPGMTSLGYGAAGLMGGMLLGNMLGGSGGSDDEEGPETFQKGLERADKPLLDSYRKRAFDLGLLQVQQGLLPDAPMGAENEETVVPDAPRTMSEAEVQNRMKQVNVVAADPAAKKFLVKVSPRLKKVLHELAEEGKL